MIFLADEAGRLVFVSDAWLKKAGYARPQVLGRNWRDFFVSGRDGGPPPWGRLERCADAPCQMLTRGGAVLDVLMSAGPIDEPGERLVMAVLTDVTALMRTQRRLHESEARYRLLAENSTDMVMALDRNLIRTYVSPASVEAFGYSPEELLGKKSGGSAHPEDAEALNDGLQSLLAGRLEKFVGLNRRQHRDGRWIWAETCYRALKDADTGEVTGIVAAVRDVSARKAAEDQLAEAYARLAILSGQDGLTGLANRRSFDDAFAREHRRALREEGSVALVMLDVDRFKAFNDLYGHPAGDEALRQIAEAIATSIRRPGDVAARYGGEEFAVVLPRTDEAGALAVAAEIMLAVRALAIPHGGSEHGVATVSLGVAALCATEATTAALLRDADAALYLAKKAGRNAVMAVPASEAAARA